MPSKILYLLFFVLLVKAQFTPSDFLTQGEIFEVGANSTEADIFNVTEDSVYDNITVAEDFENSANITERISIFHKDKVFGISKLLHIFDVETLAQNWDVIKTNLSDECMMHVEEYLAGLEQQQNWALTMDDASGRYTTGWFWGNYYWTGSQTLCEHMSPETHQSSKMLSNQSTDEQKSKPKINTGFAHLTSNGKEQDSQDSSPPFPVSFYMLKIKINTTAFSSKERVIYIGLCLPKHCTNTDVKNLMEHSAESNSKAMIEVRNISSYYNRYDMWQDNTFRVLCGATLGITLMLIAGTAYDLFLQRKKKAMKSKNQINFAKNIDITNPIHVKLDMPVPDNKISGKRIYVVNNNMEIVEESSSDTRSISSEDNLDCTSVMEQILLSFSIRININAICDKSVGADTIPTIHGLRSISMAWVILGHTCIVAFKYSDNMDFRKLVEKEFLFQTITNGAFSVDTFFFISGLLVSFLYFRTNAKGKLEPLTQGSKGFTAGCLHFVGLITYRFARLTAPYLFVLGIVEVAMKWFFYNSIFEPPTMDHINCPNYWWRNVLYINTLFPVDEMCMLWSWYLSNDTQFYIFGAIILILANSHFKTAGTLLAAFMLSSWLTTGFIAFQNHHMPNVDDPLALFDKIYDKPWTRLGPYLVGMAVGWLLFKTNCQIRMSKLTVLVGWMASIAVLLSLVYGLYETNLTPLTGAAYSSLSHTAWALGLSWIVIACTTGYGGYVNKLLSATILYPFSRVTYCAYLIHPMVLRGMTMTMDSPLHLGKETMTIIFLGQMVASYVLSFIISIAVEAPVVTMLKILTRFKVKK